ncbi:type IV toxin-antitoxin system AbiEi family antitoxin domain-containing protein [Deinococcus cellulosilyticus]|uniref:AbiEi antitoxin N-terminal domain-containing protein n=1 Tax=Deinococcus cellulosilyticus (strain DSM 18568 / NBRC 106333 / KACC 11606 / 5516J-15) TaxID=1223518 RepID=A0A511N6B8_DEIC1|nr:type IV toxin-antitoxin system AbiEi family antitoxin domain-containing protein [Deinococcus cellulosilyticus]GEM48395.1 hypothetical protein DC3_40300 [Deinococcus cellulosilyticus NBRC 106333 = KACC 11606]
MDLLQLFKTTGGYLTAQEARAAGFHNQQLRRLLHQQTIEQPQPGVYRLVNHFPTNFEDILEVQLRVEDARLCLISALDLHGLTTTRLSRLRFAVPHKKKFPTFSYPPVEVFYFQNSHHSYGQLDVPIEGTPRMVRTYTPEKTLLDLLKYHTRFGRDLYLEGLKNYLKRNWPHHLIEVAREMPIRGKNTLLSTLLHDLEVILHDIET